MKIEPDAVLDKSGPGPLEVRIAEKHSFGCALPDGTKFYIMALAWNPGDFAILDEPVTFFESAASGTVWEHLQRAYRELGWKKGDLFVTEKVADRAIALPFHAHLTPDQVAFMVAQILGVKKPGWALDASDALAVAICHLNERRMRKLAGGK